MIQVKVIASSIAQPAMLPVEMPPRGGFILLENLVLAGLRFPAVTFSTRGSAGMKHSLGRDSNYPIACLSGVVIHAKNATAACFSLFLAQYSRS